MTEHTKTPSERAKRVAEGIDEYFGGCSLTKKVINRMTDIVSAEYADLERYVEYVNQYITNSAWDKALSGQKLLTFPEWKEGRGSVIRGLDLIDEGLKNENSKEQGK